jgi:hypothetical protein
MLLIAVRDANRFRDSTPKKRRPVTEFLSRSEANPDERRLPDMAPGSDFTNFHDVEIGEIRARRHLLTTLETIYRNCEIVAFTQAGRPV